MADTYLKQRELDFADPNLVVVDGIFGCHAVIDREAYLSLPNSMQREWVETMRAGLVSMWQERKEADRG